MTRPEQTSGQTPEPTAEQVRAERERARAARTFTLSQAATACGVSRSRIRRMLDAGEFPNARQDEAGEPGSSANVWHVPLPDLLAAGLMPNREANSPERPPGGQRNSPDQTGEQEAAALRHELAIEREKRIAAEAVAAERERAIVALETALRLLESRAGATTPSEAIPGDSAPPVGADTGKPPEGPQNAAQGVESGGEPPASWWGRLRRRF